MIGRGTEKKDVIEGRLTIAKEELKRINETSFFNYKIVNDDMEKAFTELESSIKTLYPNIKA